MAINNIQRWMHSQVNSIAKNHEYGARVAALPVIVLDPLLELFKTPLNVLSSLGQSALGAIGFVFASVEYLTLSPDDKQNQAPLRKLAHTYVHLDDAVEAISLFPLKIIRSPFLVLGNTYSLLRSPKGTNEIHNHTGRTKTQDSYPAAAALSSLNRDAQASLPIPASFSFDPQKELYSKVNTLAKKSENQARLAALPVVIILDPILELGKIPLRIFCHVGRIALTALKILIQSILSPFNSNVRSHYSPIKDAAYIYTYAENIVEEILLIPIAIIRTPFLILGNLYSLLTNPKGTNSPSDLTSKPRTDAYLTSLLGRGESVPAGIAFKQLQKEARY